MKQFAIPFKQKKRIEELMLLLSLLLLGSCNNQSEWLKHEENGKIIYISEENLNDKIYEEEIYDIVVFKPIYLPDSILIGNIQEIDYNDKYYFALDGQNERVYQFDKNWNFINLLDSKGGGPKEYNQIFNINVNDQFLIINDLWQVLHYDVETLDFISYYSKNHMGFKTYVTQDCHVINHQLNSPMDDTDFNITTYNYENDSIVYRNHKIRPSFREFTFSQKNHFYNNGLSEFFVLPYNDTIYKVQNGEFSIHRIIDFGEFKLNTSNLTGQVTVKDISRSGKAFFVGDYFENEKFELFSFTLDGDRFKYQINKKTGMGIGYSSLMQTRSIFPIPVKYNLLKENYAISFKNIEDANFELSSILSRSESLPINLKKTLDHFEKKLKKASGLIVEYQLKEQ